MKEQEYKTIGSLFPVMLFVEYMELFYPRALVGRLEKTLMFNSEHEVVWCKLTSSSGSLVMLTWITLKLFSSVEIDSRGDVAVVWLRGASRPFRKDHLRSRLRMDWTPSKGSLLKKEEKETGKKIGYRKPAEDKVAAAVRKALFDAVKWASPLEVDGIVDPDSGLTLRQFLARDKALELSSKGSVSFGASYYKDLKRRFSASSKADALLEEMAKKLPAAEEERDTFVVAYAATLKSPPNRSFFKDFIETTESLLNCEGIATAQFLCDLSPSSSAEQLHLCLSILKSFVRMNLFSQIDELQTVLKPVIENILVEVIHGKRSLKAQRRKGLFTFECQNLWSKG
eukprot:2271628-Amphidinium_carterae.2